MPLTWNTPSVFNDKSPTRDVRRRVRLETKATETATDDVQNEDPYKISKF